MGFTQAVSDATGTPIYPAALPTPIAGGFASAQGGYIDIYTNYGYVARKGNAYGAQKPSYNQIISLDVAEWQIQETLEQSPLACSGNLGATDARQTGYSYAYKASVVWNFNAAPETILRGIAGAELVFWLGYVTQNGLASPGNLPAADRYYWTPDAVLESASPITNAAGKKFARVLIQGRMRSHCFLVPDMGNPGDSTTIAGAYRQWYWCNTLPFTHIV